jgi:hypothetical protein
MRAAAATSLGQTSCCFPVTNSPATFSSSSWFCCCFTFLCVIHIGHNHISRPTPSACCCCWGICYTHCTYPNPPCTTTTCCCSCCCCCCCGLFRWPRCFLQQLSQVPQLLHNCRRKLALPAVRGLGQQQQRHVTQGRFKAVRPLLLLLLESCSLAAAAANTVAVLAAACNSGRCCCCCCYCLCCWALCQHTAQGADAIQPRARAVLRSRNNMSAAPAAAARL